MMIIYNNMTFVIRSLSIAYKGRVVLTDVNLNVPAKQITAVIGPSGCGKSTLLRALNRTLELVPGAEVKSGEVYFQGKNIYDKDTDVQIVRKRIGMVMQKPIAFPLSIKENVLFGVKFHKNFNGKSKGEIVETSLKTVGLFDEVKDRLNDKAYALSLGQLQRLCIARALANNPEALLMDEPCSALDPISTGKIEELILQLKDRLPIFIVTHNIAQAKRISDYCLFLSDGRVLQQCNTLEIFENPLDEKVRDFITGRIG
ncbi:MAG: phosphate ABC transporter ATP-binding protein [Syntrophorhabdaceae bacterium]|nr:phosphate ABC transporter ATP-binding protein [Syntrophorhabdaceae bacterium]